MCLKSMKGLYRNRLELNRVFGGKSMLWHVYNRGDSRLEIDLYRIIRLIVKLEREGEGSRYLPMASEYALAASLN